MFSSAVSLNKVEFLQKRALCFIYDNYDSSYKSILKLAGKSTVNVTLLDAEVFVLNFFNGIHFHFT